MLEWRSLMDQKEESAVHHEFNFQSLATAVIALVLSFIFACSNVTLRMKAPEETEKTIAKTVVANLRKKK